MARSSPMTPLPIDSVLTPLRQALSQNRCAVLQAAPGAGKTTRVPLALYQEPWLHNKKILMLEPRRLAARAAAQFMARQLGEPIGKTVGYRVRLDSKVSHATRIEVVTEGILTRLLQADPELSEFGLIIFDEFHERNLQSDLGLALCLDAQAALRDDLRILVMSATLDGQAVAQFLQQAPLIISEGRSYPVNIHYRPVSHFFARERYAFLDEVAQHIRHAVQHETGSLLVFLPGTSEIHFVENALRQMALGNDIVLAPLYSQLSATAQDEAITPAPSGKRKIVLATSIAETSLTIDGIRVVVDAGLSRTAQFDPNTGFSQLVTLAVSQAAADQRCGRAGRLEAGVCYRLWAQHHTLIPHTAAEILESDLAAFVLELAQWGVTDSQQLRWLTPPPTAHVNQARDLLHQLSALDADGRITTHGKQINTLGAHPRLAHMMLRGKELGIGQLACELAALLSERDPLRGPLSRESDVLSRLEAIRGLTRDGVDIATIQRIRDAASQWQQQLSLSATKQRADDLIMAGVLLAFAYPDRVAQRRATVEPRYLLSNGRGALLREAEPLAASDYIVVAHLDGAREARIFLAARVTREDLLRFHRELFHSTTSVVWDDRQQCVQARRQQRLGELIIQDEPWEQAEPTQITQALISGIRQRGLACLPWNDNARELQQRLQFLHQLDAVNWPDCSDEHLLASLEIWLQPYLDGLSRISHLSRLDLGEVLRSGMSWQKRQQLDELAPTHLTVPSGSHIRIDYSGATPVLAVRLQEMFGLSDTPRIAGGRIAVLLHLLSPAQRPVQITQDLAGFWQGSYHDVKKDLKGRYPKHHWPDDPLQAPPTARAKRRPPAKS